MQRTSMKAFLGLMSLLFATLVLGVGVMFLTPRLEAAPTEFWFALAVQLPADGEPVRVTIKSPQRDAWMRLSDRVLGHIFVRQLPNGQILALRAEHHGDHRIPVAYDEAARVFRSCCWGTRYDLNGKEFAEKGRYPLGEDMERLPTWVGDGAVWVRYPRPEE